MFTIEDESFFRRISRISAQQEERRATKALDNEQSSIQYFSNGGSIAKVFAIYNNKMQKEDNNNVNANLVEQLNLCCTHKKTYNERWIVKILAFFGFIDTEEEIWKKANTEVAANFNLIRGRGE